MSVVSARRFPLGQVVGTPGALDAIDDAGQSPKDFLDRHARCDWGDCCDEDKELNDESVIDGSRILSVYMTSKGVKLWVITEAVDDDGMRAATTILLPSEY